MKPQLPGKATHYKEPGKASACGRRWVAFSTCERRKVDCRQCLRALKGKP